MATPTPLPDDAVADAAEALHALGVSVIPIKTGTKEPVPGLRWGAYAAERADASERYTWFREAGHQLAVVAGPVSGNLVILDYDGDRGYETHAAEWPALARLPRVRTGSGKVHCWLRTSAPVAKYVCRLSDGSRLEVRAGTHYTLAPPSLHPSGQRYRWEQPIGPEGIPVVDLTTLGLEAPSVARPVERGPVIGQGAPLTAHERANLIRLLRPAWQPGQRHDVSLAVAGWLASHEVPEADTLAVLDALLLADDDQGKIGQTVRDTYRRTAEGYAVVGWSGLTDTDRPLVTAATAKQLDLLLRGRNPLLILSRPLDPERGREVLQGGLTAADLQQQVFAPLRWVVAELLPEGATLLAGKAKARKSWLALGVAVEVARGGVAVGAYAVTRGAVLYLDLEGNLRRNQERLRLMLGDAIWPDNLYIYTEWEVGQAGVELLDQWIADHPDTVLVVIDVWQDFRPAMPKNVNMYDWDRDTVKRVNQWAERHHVAVLMLHHTRKQSDEDVFHEISGSTGLQSAVATMWVLSPAPDGQAKLNLRGRDLRNDEPLALAWEPLAFQHRVVGPAAAVLVTSERGDILKLLGDDVPRSPQAVAEALGRSVGSVKNLLAKLLSDGQIERVSHGTYGIRRLLT